MFTLPGCRTPQNNLHCTPLALRALALHGDEIFFFQTPILHGELCPALPSVDFRGNRQRHIRADVADSVPSRQTAMSRWTRSLNCKPVRRALPGAAALRCSVPLSCSPAREARTRAGRQLDSPHGKILRLNRKGSFIGSVIALAVSLTSPGGLRGPNHLPGAAGTYFRA